MSSKGNQGAAGSLAQVISWEQEALNNADPTQREFWKANREGSLDRMRAALEQGADPHASEPTDGGAYPIHRACSKVSDDALRLLLSVGCSLDVRDEEGSLPIHFACQDVASLMAAWFPPERVETDDTRRPLSLLIELGADLGARNNHGYEPLHVAASVGFDWGVRTLLAAGADPTARDAEGRLPEEVAEKEDRQAAAGLLRSARETRELSDQTALARGPSAPRGL